MVTSVTFVEFSQLLIRIDQHSVSVLNYLQTVKNNIEFCFGSFQQHQGVLWQWWLSGSEYSNIWLRRHSWDCKEVWRNFHWLPGIMFCLHDEASFGSRPCIGHLWNEQGPRNEFFFFNVSNGIYCLCHMKEHLKNGCLANFERVQLNRNWTKGLQKSRKLETLYGEGGGGGQNFRKGDICMGISWFLNACFLASFQSNMLKLAEFTDFDYFMWETA